MSTDFFELTGQKYLILMDYYSRFLEILSLMEIKSQAVIQKLSRVCSVVYSRRTGER